MHADRRRRTVNTIRTATTITTLGLVAMIMAGCASGTSTASVPNEEAAPSVSELRLGYFANVTHAPALVGLEEGLFEDALGDVKVTKSVFNAGPAAIEALTAGAIDATYIGPNPSINTFIQSGGQSAHIISFGPIVLHGTRHDLRQRNLLQQRRQILQRTREAQAAPRHLISNLDEPCAVLVGQCVEQAHEVALVNRTEHAAHGSFAHFAGAVGDGLIRERQRITHRTLRSGSQQAQRIRFVGDVLFTEDAIEVGHDVPRRHLLEVELQAARQHRHRNLLRVGGRENELDVLRRLFQRLQHRVEGVVGQHVHFVDHVDLEATNRRGIDRAVEQLGHLVDTTIGRSIHLDVIDKTPGIDLRTGTAHAARLRGDTALPVCTDAVERFGENARQRGLADTARPREEVGMVQALLFERMRERAHHVLLTDERGEIARAPLAGEHLITHAADCSKARWISDVLSKGSNMVRAE